MREFPVIFVLILVLFPSFSYAENEILSKALKYKIYEKPEWKALLHYNGSSSYIKDRRFILSSDNFSLKEELKKTVLLITSTADSDNPAVCRFPARWLFILKETGEKFDAGIGKCKVFKRFLSKLEGEDIYLGYVSKDVTDATRMMGHLFFEFEGKEDYSVSFLALVGSSNPLKLGWKSVFTNIDAGLFIEPFNTQLDKYLWIEGRNVWRYSLNLSDYRKQLLLYHIYELKNTELKYNYLFYNCATVVYYLLSLASPSLLERKPVIVTPLKTIRSAYNNKLLENEEFFENAVSLMEKLQREVGFKSVWKIKKGDGKNLNGEESFLYSVYRCYRSLEKNVKSEYCDVNLKKFADKRSLLDASFENHLFIGFRKDFDRENFLYFRFFPVSNEIFDDNRYSLREESVKFGEVEVGLSSGDLRIYKAGLIEINSFKGFTFLVPQISKRLFIGFKRFTDKLSAFVFSFGAGISLKPRQDFTVYLFLNQDIGGGDRGGFTRLYPSVGVIFYSLKKGKTVVSLDKNFLFPSHLPFPDMNLSVTQVFYLNKHLNLDFGFERIYGESGVANRLTLSTAFLF